MSELNVRPLAAAAPARASKPTESSSPFRITSWGKQSNTLAISGINPVGDIDSVTIYLAPVGVPIGPATAISKITVPAKVFGTWAATLPLPAAGSYTIEAIQGSAIWTVPFTVAAPAPPPPPPPPVVTPVTTGPLVLAPAIPQPSAPGDVVGLVLQNNQSSVLASREITFGQEFAAGQVAAGSKLVAIVNGATIPVQMDVKTTNPDGSVAMAVLTMQQPALAAASSTNVMLRSATAPSAPPVDLTRLATAGYSVVVDLALHNASGGTTAVHIDVGQALAAALRTSAVSYWLQGPQATEARIDIPVSGSLHLTADITAYADGTTSTDLQFNNDLAMTANGGAVTYDATIRQNGTVAFAQSNITQYQYQTWHQQVWSNGAPQVNVQHDVLALEKTGAIQAYDLTTGVAASVINHEAIATTGSGFGVLGNAGITEYMPMTGARADIGATTQANATWLLTQNQTAAQYALAQADAAGSVPWHFFDPTTGTYLNVANYPKLWTDPAAVRLGFTALTQAMPTAAQTGWTPDLAHEPDLDYVAYLMTGNRYYLDQLNAEASYDIISTGPNGRLKGQGIVADGADQVRAQAWNLREIVEAASANPVGSAEKAYFTNIMNANFTFLLGEATTANQGQASGWIPGNANGSGEICTVDAGLFCHDGGPRRRTGCRRRQATPALGNQLSCRAIPRRGPGIRPASRHRLPAQRLRPRFQREQRLSDLGADREDHVVKRRRQQRVGKRFELDQRGRQLRLTGACLARRRHHGHRLSRGDGCIWLDHGYATQAGTAYQQLTPAFDIAPRLPDGQFLTSDHIIVSSDTIAAHLQGSNADQLIYETGSGNVTITGGTGINLLFAGSGNDTLLGGPNRDYLFGGSGTDILSAGAGNNYLEPGTGAAKLLLAAADFGKRPDRQLQSRH